MTAVVGLPTGWSVNMKQAFFKLTEAKREKIISACLAEFGAHGFDKAALDRIVEAAGISKGGLYEYISTKEELYLYTVELSYAKLYDYIRDTIERAGQSLPDDLLERFSLVARTAIGFYVEHSAMIGIIAGASRIEDHALADKAKAIFEAHFSRIFSSTGDAGLAVSKERLIEFLKWILVKTRNDFLKEVNTGSPIQTVTADYVEEWDFFLSILRRGVYAK
jgi:AcrR family transcriptional regulator